MPTNAYRIHADLVNALDRLRSAEQSAVTLFARVLRDELHKPLGYASMELYGTEGLGLSLAMTRQFLRLARALDDLPITRAALDDGRLSWTKARTITAVATPRTEEQWVTAASSTTSRDYGSRDAERRVRNSYWKVSRNWQRGEEHVKHRQLPTKSSVTDVIAATR